MGKEEKDIEKVEKRSIEELIDEIGSKPTFFSIIAFIAAFAQNSVI